MNATMKNAHARVEDITVGSILRVGTLLESAGTRTKEAAPMARSAFQYAEEVAGKLRRQAQVPVHRAQGNLRRGEVPVRVTTQPDPKRTVTVTELAIEDYDNVSLASLRSKMVHLDRDEVSLLRDYESTHKSRDNVLGMLDRRLAKLT